MTTFDLSRYQDPLTIQRVLLTAKTIAVVGLSANALRASYFVGFYLQRHGYRVIPVNPRESEILGKRCYPSLHEVPEKVDIVNVFRAPSALPDIAAQAVAIGANKRVSPWSWIAVSRSSTPATWAECTGSASIRIGSHRCAALCNSGTSKTVLIGGWLCRPRIDDINAAILEILHVARGKTCPSGTSHGGNHGVELADRFSRHSSQRRDFGVHVRGIAIETQYLACKIFGKDLRRGIP